MTSVVSETGSVVRESATDWDPLKDPSGLLDPPHLHDGWNWVTRDRSLGWTQTPPHPSSRTFRQTRPRALRTGDWCAHETGVTNADECVCKLSLMCVSVQTQSRSLSFHPRLPDVVRRGVPSPRVSVTRDSF